MPSCRDKGLAESREAREQCRYRWPRAHNPKHDGLILDALGVALMAVDEHCRIVRFNSRAEMLTGVTSSVALNSPCFDVLQGGLCDASCPLRQALDTGTSHRSGIVILQPQGKPAISVEMTASVLYGSSGGVTGAVGILRDVASDVSQMRFYGSRIFVSRTPEMRRIFDFLPRLAGSRAPLLIEGELGAGRAALAETIHQLGEGYERPMLTLRCNEQHEGPHIIDQLGTDFTARLKGGTLLLQNIDSASTSLQQELLAWLEENENEADVRLISTATNPLEQCLAAGDFRQDLYYRLNVLHIELPGLRGRREDIPLLVEHFVEAINAQRGTEIEGLSAAAMQQLMVSDLPGNVRQLRRILEQAHLVCGGKLIDVDDLPLTTGGCHSSRAKTTPW